MIGAEEPLPAGGSCLLGSINLSEFVKNQFKNDSGFDFNDFSKAVNTGVIALNEVLHEGLSLHPLKEQRDSVDNWKQIGLGLFGWHDALIKLGIRYGSQESFDIANEIGKIFINKAILSSSKLTEKYSSYPMYDSESVLSSPFFIANTNAETKEYVKKHGLTNSQLLTIPPTGSTATMLGVSTALEPIYNISYTRKTESLHGKDEYYKVYTPIVEQYMKISDTKTEDELPEYFNTAMTLDYKERIEMQSIWQKYIDASISSTVNVPESFTVEDTENLYMMAFDKGLKGVTLFRDNCARIGILTNSTKKESNATLQRGDVIEVSNDVIGRKRKLMTGCGSLHCQAFFDPVTGELLETYLSKGSTGGCQNFMVGLSRMISYATRIGGNIYDIVDQLNSCGVCPSYAVRKATKGDTSIGSCCPIAVGNALLDMYKEIQYDLGLTEDYEQEDCVSAKHPCPVCHQELKFEGGCQSCPSCGYSKCE